MIQYDAAKIRTGLPKYMNIMKLAKQSKDISVDKDFQKAFKGFYLAGPMGNNWYDEFFKLFQEARDKNLSFEDVIDMFYDSTGRVELSFCSKMIHTIDPTKPIIDQYILWKFGFNTAQSYKDNPELAKMVYEDICEQYETHMNDTAVIDVLTRFDKDFPAYKNIEKIKKLDFIFWSLREFRIYSLLEYENK